MALSTCIVMGLGAASGSPTVPLPQNEARVYERKAIDAYQKKDMVGFLDNMKQAQSRQPTHPRFLYNLAVAYMINGKPDEAIAHLGMLARMGLVMPAERDPDFDEIKNSTEFREITKRFEQNAAHVGSSQIAFSIPQKDLITEGVAYDPKDGAFYVGSVHQRKIVKVAKDGKVSDFANRNFGLFSVLGMKVDAKRRQLWVCTTAFPQMVDFNKGVEGRAAVYVFDLRNGRLLKTYDTPDDGQKHALGDLVIARNGDVYATDSVAPVIYRIDAKAETMQEFLRSDQFLSLQGLDFSPDGKRLFVADYAKGVYSIDVVTKSITDIADAPDSTMISIDGLYFYKGSLIAIQNGINPQRVVRMYLDKTFSRVERFEILEAAHPQFDEPTLGVLVRDTFYYVGNSQWESVDERGVLAPEEKRFDPIVFKIALKK